MVFLRQLVQGLRTLLTTRSVVPRASGHASAPDPAPASAPSIPAEVAASSALAQLPEQAGELWRAYVDHSPHALFLTDARGRYIDANPAATIYAGYERAELLQMGIADLLAPSSLAEGSLHFQRLCENGKSFGELLFRRKTGEPVWWSVSAFKLTETRFLGICTDITEQKRVEAELRRNEQRQAKVFANIGDVVAILDLNGINRFKSPNIERCFGWRPEEVLGTSAWNNIHPDDHDSTRRFMAELLAVPNSTGVVECRYQCKDGSYKWIECVGSNLVHDPDIQGLLLNYHDISARKQAEAEQAAMEAQLQQTQKMDSIGRLAGGIAHDFNNMLAATILQLNLLGSNPSLDQEARQAIADLEDGARRAARLTRQLLMYSRRATLQLKSSDLNEVVENLLKMLRRVIGENYSLEFATRGQISPIRADAGMIEQVLLNFALNARDAMPSGGLVRILTYGKEWTKEACLANPKRREGHFVCLEVSDAGCGIPPGNLAAIFEPFFTTKEVGQGTGLGLPTVDGIVGQHKGWVEVQSELGKGSCFQVFLPAELGKVVPRLPVVVPERVAPGRETILLVEDELAVRLIVGKSLEQLGYKVLSAVGPVEALLLWQQHAASIQLLLTDMMMPGGMTGLELCHELRKTQPSLPVIIMSGYCKDLKSTGAELAGTIEFLQKPFAVPDLARVLRGRLDRS